MKPNVLVLLCAAAAVTACTKFETPDGRDGGDARLNADVAADLRTDRAGDSPASTDTPAGSDTPASVDVPPADVPPACQGGGQACDPKVTCRAGTFDCTSGTPVCTVSGNAPEGSDCGASKVCSGGQCVACSAGMACTPANKCHTGTLSCVGGTPSCTDSGSNASDGASCGQNLVCKAGACAACTTGAACTPTVVCKTGQIACTTGAPVCMVSGNVPDSQTCGSGMVCSGGNCVAACAAGVACTQGIGACRAGKTFCASAVSQAECRDSGADDTHATCANGNVCKNGACVAPCVANVDCRPTACHAGKTVCSSPTATAICTGSAIDDSKGGCTGGNICVNGGCVAPCQPHCVNAAVAISCSGNTEVTNVCAANTTCNADSKTCVPCGQMWGQKCCPSQLENDHCSAGPESFCLKGICTSTGHIGEPCFPGGGCKFATTVCKAGMCIACGPNAGNTCCDPNRDSTPPNGCTPL